MTVDMYQNLVALIDLYNQEVAVPGGYAPISRNVVRKGAASSQVKMPCKIKHLGDQSYGKFPKDMISEQILMEYKHLFVHVQNYLPSASTLDTNFRFRNFLRVNGTKKAMELA